MPVEVRESKASATASAGGGSRLFASVEAAIDDFVSTESPSSVDFVDTEKLSDERVCIVIGYSA